MISQLFYWRSILDIFLIAAALFFLYQTLNRLGTWKIVAGLLIAAVIFIISSFLDLTGIEWIYRNVSHVAVLSLVVLFQPELRKVFEKAASMKQYKAHAYDEEFSRLISTSLWKMALNRTGAIVVVPGSEPVTPWLNGGFPLNAHPSLPLIISLFDPHSPGHDGAVVLAPGSLESFGVRLPVSQSGRLSEDYGTRHQAAMGLSEQCDALVIVCSEERGQVSAFFKGDMKIMKSEDDIFYSICFHCRKAGRYQFDFPRKTRIKKMTLEFMGSVAVALVFWMTLIAGQGEKLEKIISVPVEFTATADDVIMIGEKLKEVKLHLAGSKSDLDAVIPTSMSVKIDLSKSGEGTQTYPINEDNIQMPKGIRLIDMDPSSVDITMAKLVRKDIEIKPQLIGRLLDDIEIVSVRTVPEHVRVFLPSGEEVDNGKNVSTTPIYLVNIREDTTLFCKIVAPPTIQPVDKRWPDVTVFIYTRMKNGPKE